jgi:hypothetical protein
MNKKYCNIFLEGMRKITDDSCNQPLSLKLFFTPCIYNIKYIKLSKVKVFTDVWMDS